jgi:hypothetical protein
LSNLILLKVQSYLAQLQVGGGDGIKSSSLDNFFKAANKTLTRQLSPERKDKEFRLYMSNLGRAGCTLQAEKFKYKKEPSPYSNRFRNLYGDLVEAAAIALMREAGVNIIEEQKWVTLQIAEQEIRGGLDLIIDEGDGPKIYDVKSASSYMFQKYSEANLGSLWRDGDLFGYVTQIYLYAKATGHPVGGLIVINKESGEWCVVEPPQNEDDLRLKALSRAVENVLRIKNETEFRKDFEEEPEVYRKKPTGNMVLPFACQMCDFKGHCWPDYKLVPQVVSSGDRPKLVYYTKIVTEKDDGKES